MSGVLGFCLACGRRAHAKLDRRTERMYDGGRWKELWNVDVILGFLFRVWRPAGVVHEEGWVERP